MACAKTLLFQFKTVKHWFGDFWTVAKTHTRCYFPISVFLSMIFKHETKKQNTTNKRTSERYSVLFDDELKSRRVILFVTVSIPFKHVTFSFLKFPTTDTVTQCTMHTGWDHCTWQIQIKIATTYCVLQKPQWSTFLIHENAEIENVCTFLFPRSLSYILFS